MVNLLTSALALLTATQLVTAVPSEYEVRSENLGDFSYQSWADSIAKNPEGSHLSPEEVIEKYVSTNNSEEDGNSLTKRGVSCNTVAQTSAAVPDAVWCINYLAARPNQNCAVAAGGSIAFCTHGLAQIVGVSGRPAWQGGTSSHCGDVARAAGRIMDVCTRGSVVQGENTAYGNGFLGVNIRRP